MIRIEWCLEVRESFLHPTLLSEEKNIAMTLRGPLG